MRKDTTKTTFHLWMEGWKASGCGSEATYHGEVEARSFREACIKKFKGDTNFRDGDVPSVWGCRLFNNEKDARKAFG